MDFRKRFLVEPGKAFKLGARDPGDTAGVESKKDAKAAMKKSIKRMNDLQRMLYAEGRRSVLIVLQAMDAGGKDGTIRRVLGPLNPQGVDVSSFKTPTAEELGHDFLWRIHRATPRHGMIGVFNRSHYEDVLIVRVHDLVPKAVWSKRYDHINAFEKSLADSGTVILKFFLHISKDTQLERFRKRLETPHKNWKFSPADVAERQLWDRYMEAYEAAVGRCSTPHGPWYVIPSNHKWFRNLAVSQIVADALEDLDMAYPKPTFDPDDITLE